MDAAAKKALQDLQDAQAALDDNYASLIKDGATEPTAEHERLNKAVNDAEANAKAAGVPWWRRWPRP